MSGLKRELFFKCFFFLYAYVLAIYIQLNVSKWAGDASHQTKSDDSAGNVVFLCAWMFN